jgi:hypothetical protein
MLIIEPGDEVVLSQKYHSAHNVSVHLHDQMVNILVNDAYDEFRRARFDITDEMVLVKEMRNQEVGILDFFEANGMRNEVTDVLVRDIVQALLTDFLHFIHESLSAAKRGKISVAYALLRKPLTDLLLLLEQILVNKQDFIDRFHYAGAPVGYDPSFANLDKKTIVAAATAKLVLCELFSNDIIYELRYDKSAKYGIAGSTHQALHIVTRNPHFHTRDRDFNFIFDTVDSIDGYWANYYHVVPYILCYAASVMDEIVFDFMPSRERAKWVKNIQRFVLFTAFQEEKPSQEIAGSENEMFTPILNALTHSCKTCAHEIHFTKPDLILFGQSTVILCDNCFTDQFLDDDFYTKFLITWSGVVPNPPA